MWAGDDFGNWKNFRILMKMLSSQFSSWREDIKRPLRWIQDYALVTVCLTDLFNQERRINVYIEIKLD